MDRDTGALNPSELDPLLSARTKFLTVTHCSNIVAHVNPIAQITTKARTAGAVTIVDRVAFAPHGVELHGVIPTDRTAANFVRVAGYNTPPVVVPIE